MRQSVPQSRRNLCLLALLLFATPALAQPSPVQINEELNRAMALEAKKDWAGAIDIYQRLCDQLPQRGDLFSRLESALSRAGRYAEAAALTRQRLAVDPNDVDSRLRLGQALLALGEVDSAGAHWDRLLQRATTLTPFAIVADHYRRRNLDARAEQAYRRARLVFKNPALFARELAELAERQVRYPDAVREYLICVADNP